MVELSWISITVLHATTIHYIVYIYYVICSFFSIKILVPANITILKSPIQAPIWS